jgi:hypothetical protein
MEFYDSGVKVIHANEMGNSQPERDDRRKRSQIKKVAAQFHVKPRVYVQTIICHFDIRP